MKRTVAPAVALAVIVCGALVTEACGSSEDAAGPIGCPGAPVKVGTPSSLASASYTNACEGATQFITWSNAGPGEPCTSAKQCKPTCCLCSPGSNHSALTSWCDHGRCADANDVCCAVAGTSLASCG